MQHRLQFQVVEHDVLSGVGDDRADEGGEEAGVARGLHVAVVLIEAVLGRGEID